MSPTKTPHTDPEQWSAHTLAVAGARPEAVNNAPVNHPVTFTSTFHSQAVAGGGDRVYARFANPSWDGFEQLLGQLELSTLPALVYSSGMAAIAAALSLVPRGGTLVLPRHSYNGSLSLLAQMEAAGDVVVRPIDITDTAAGIAALQGADALWLESPTNPMLEVAELPVLLAAAAEHGVLSLVDNTFATPLLQRPLGLGADVVVHSVTKSLSGHSDVVLGAAVTSNPQLREKLHAYRTLHGAIASPMDVFLALRGMRTLSVRLERAQSNAQFLAEQLETHPAVGAVRYPGLPGDPGHGRAREQMDGFGSIIALEVGADAPAADRVIAALRLITPATSLGGVETLAERRARHASEPASVPPNLIRLSVGIEDPQDLWRDLSQALGSLEG